MKSERSDFGSAQRIAGKRYPSQHPLRQRLTFLWSIPRYSLIAYSRVFYQTLETPRNEAKCRKRTWTAVKLKLDQKTLQRQRDVKRQPKCARIGLKWICRSVNGQVRKYVRDLRATKSWPVPLLIGRESGVRFYSQSINHYKDERNSERNESYSDALCFPIEYHM